MMERFFGERVRSSGGCVTGNATEHAAGNRLSLETGRRPRGNSGNAFRPETETSCKSFDRARAFSSENGRSFSWRTIPSRLSETLEQDFCYSDAGEYNR